MKEREFKFKTRYNLSYLLTIIVSIKKYKYLSLYFLSRTGRKKHGILQAIYEIKHKNQCMPGCKISLRISLHFSIFINIIFITIIYIHLTCHSLQLHVFKLFLYATTHFIFTKSCKVVYSDIFAQYLFIRNKN